MEELDDIVNLLRRYLAGSLTELERERLERWAAQHSANRALLESLADEQTLLAGYISYLQVYDEAVSGRLERIGDALMQSIGVPHKRFDPNRRLTQWLPYAAAVLLAAVAAAWFYFEDPSRQEKVVQVHDILPGGNRATLALADGRTITLDEARNGIVIGDDAITYNDGVTLDVIPSGDEKQRTATFLELTTPNGGTYQITLADGTKVWLNAGSTLKYPISFSRDERVVEIIGEAYFVVARDENRPFRVKTEDQTVEVLGTAFNISAYGEEVETKTTLVEGVVQVENSASRVKTKLMPGQQSITRGASTDITKVAVAQYIAWKSDMFHFKHTPLADMMRQIERWYDVEVVYRDGIPPDTFSGRMRRDVSLLTVLDLLEASEINFRVEGSVLIIE